MAEGINTTSINLPAEVSSEILQKAQEQSAVMRLANHMDIPERGVSIPIITGDPEAQWTKETEKKAVSTHKLETKLLTPYTLAVIVPFSNQFKKSAQSLYEVMVQRLPLALANKFDATVFGSVDAPGENFDTFKSVTAQDIGAKTYNGLVAAKSDIGKHKGTMNGIVLSEEGESIMLLAADTTGRPLFINPTAADGVPVILGAPTYKSTGAYIAGTPNTVGFAGDWTQAVYGTVNGTGVEVSISDQATLTVGDTTINLWQQNMFAVRCEIELGFRADTTVFNKLTQTAA